MKKRDKELKKLKHISLHIEAKKNETVDSMLRRFKKNVKLSGLMKEIKDAIPVLEKNGASDTELKDMRRFYEIVNQTDPRTCFKSETRVSHNILDSSNSFSSEKS